MKKDQAEEKYLEEGQAYYNKLNIYKNKLNKKV